MKKRVKIADIKVGDRFREELGDIEALSVSIEMYGLIHPVVIDEDMNLIAGFRRLSACKKLGHTEISVRGYEALTELERKEIEAEENWRRKNLTWVEEVKAKQELHRLKQEMHGEASAGRPSKGGEKQGWSLRDMADYTGESASLLSKDIQLAAALEDYPELAQSKDKHTAHKRLALIKERAILSELAAREKDTIKQIAPIGILSHGDAIDIMKKELEPDSVDMVLMDPPYAKDLEIRSATSPKPYHDVREELLPVIGEVMREAHRVLKWNRVMLVFFDISNYQPLLELAEDAGFYVCNLPLIWNKEGGRAVLPFDHLYAHGYEAILHCQKGRRSLNMPGKPNVLSNFPPVSSQRRIHPVQKPLSILKYLISQHTTAGELVIDPFAGAASTLIAAIELHRRAWGCEIDEDYYNAGVVAIGKCLERMERAVSADKGEIEVDINTDEPTTYKELTPGTEKWIRWWKSHPEDQEGMLKMARDAKKDDEGR